MKRIFQWKKYIISSSSSKLEWKFFGFCQISLGRVVKAAYYLSIATLSEKIRFWKYWCSLTNFGHWAKIFWLSAEKILAVLSKSHSTSPLVPCENNFLLQNNIYFPHRFWTWSEIFLSFVKIFTAGLSKLHTTCLLGTCEAKIFWKFFLKFFCLVPILSNFFSSFYRSSLLGFG